MAKEGVEGGETLRLAIHNLKEDQAVGRDLPYLESLFKQKRILFLVCLEEIKIKVKDEEDLPGDHNGDRNGNHNQDLSQGHKENKHHHANLCQNKCARHK